MQIKTVPSSARVAVGNKITITCSLAGFDNAVYWTREVGSVHYVIINNDIPLEAIEHTDRYVYTRAVRNGMNEAQLHIESEIIVFFSYMYNPCKTLEF